MIVKVSVTAEFVLPQPVASNGGMIGIPTRLQLEPCDSPRQRVLSSGVRSSTAVAAPLSIVSPDGTRTTMLELAPGEARVEANASVRLGKPAHARRRVPPTSWEQCAATVRGIRSSGRTGDETTLSVSEALFIAAASMPSPAAPVDDDARDLSFSTFSPGQPLIMGIAEIAAKIAARKLSPEDSSHRMIAAMRALGLAASFVRGVSPATGLHTWAEIYIPGFGWFPIDAAASSTIDDGSVALVWGRDALDVPLVRAQGLEGATVTASISPRTEDRA